MANQRIEDYVPVVKYNGGIQTALPAIFEGGVTGLNGTIYPIVSPAATVSAQAATATLVAADLNKNITNTGAAGTIVLTLPSVVGLSGYVMHVELTVAQIVRLTPVAGQAIALGGSAVVSKYLNIAAVIGNMVDIFCDGTQWLVVARDGVVTKEP